MIETPLPILVWFLCKKNAKRGIPNTFLKFAKLINIYNSVKRFWSVPITNGQMYRLRDKKRNVQTVQIYHGQSIVSNSKIV